MSSAEPPSPAAVTLPPTFSVPVPLPPPTSDR